MGLKDKINKVISEQKILLEAKIQSSEDKTEAYFAECRKRMAKIIEFCEELQDSANFPLLEIELGSAEQVLSGVMAHITLYQLSMEEYLAQGGLVGSTRGEVVQWRIHVNSGKTPEGEDQIFEGFDLGEDIYTKGGSHHDRSERRYDTDQEVMDYLIENIGKWVAIIETDYDWVEEDLP